MKKKRVGSDIIYLQVTFLHCVKAANLVWYIAQGCVLLAVILSFWPTLLQIGYPYRPDKLLSTALPSIEYCFIQWTANNWGQLTKVKEF